MRDSVIITGGSGGIGTAIKKIFFDNGYQVISIDKIFDPEYCHKMLEIDIERIASEEDEKLKAELTEQILEACSTTSLRAFVHNAAIQVVKPLVNVTIDDLSKSLSVNMMASLVLAQALFPLLKKSHGSIVNIGSVHASQTKEGFGCYSISKTALAGLTKAMAIEWGSEVPVNSIDPAAVDTNMLRAGFAADKELIKKLNECHPTKSIASTAEVAQLAYFLIDQRIAFLNGANLELDGGISKVLNDI